MFDVGDHVKFQTSGGAWTFGIIKFIPGRAPNGETIYQVHEGSSANPTIHILLESAIQHSIQLQTSYHGGYPDVATSIPAPAWVKEFTIKKNYYKKCDCGLHAVDPTRMVGHSRGCPFEHYGLKGFDDNF